MDEEIAQINALLNEGGNQNNNLAAGMERMDIVDNHNDELQRLARAGNEQHNQVNQVVRPHNFQNAQLNAGVPGQQGVQNPLVVEGENGRLQQQQNARLEHPVHPQALQLQAHVINGQGQGNLNVGQHNPGRAAENADNAGQHLLGPLQNIPVNQQNNLLMQGPIMRVNRNRNGRRAPYAAANSEMRRNASRMATFLWNMAKECTFVPNRNNNNEDQENNQDQENN